MFLSLGALGRRGQEKDEDGAGDECKADDLRRGDAEPCAPKHPGEFLNRPLLDVLRRNPKNELERGSRREENSK